MKAKGQVTNQNTKKQINEKTVNKVLAIIHTIYFNDSHDLIDFFLKFEIEYYLARSPAPELTENIENYWRNQFKAVIEDLNFIASLANVDDRDTIKVKTFKKLQKINERADSKQYTLALINQQIKFLNRLFESIPN